MTGTDTELEPFDSTDEGILRDLREVASRLDPCPADLTERILFALTVQALQAEVAELTSQTELVSRSMAPDPTEASTVTFSAEHLSIMVTVVREDARHTRIDGWLTCGSAEVEVDLSDGRVETVLADAEGRFVVTGLPQGSSARLTVRPEEGRPVITPQFSL
ncbi:hypothetical protein [Ornithinimicrobium tianjinense]|uniref:Carboxypeptidase regulatory-like domain-containing protein n=1 Tax=Ornithinimicrobium tianjinense TaxID=1195761 RepID=A0A917F238_9MICO|nr:hypothetical protein [Ornithinimicrobium tianjinense]GGF42559.1 hypothetical protein GCM10011366_07940 [Ornithinimicrobium tianjinense]